MKNVDDEFVGGSVSNSSSGNFGNVESKRRLEMDKQGSAEGPQESSSSWSCSCSGKFHVRKGYVQKHGPSFQLS